jgi:hypothetical protein
MNCFVLGAGVSHDTAERARNCLQSFAEQHPQLDVRSLDHQSFGDCFIAWVHAGDAAAAPRRYVHRTATETVLWDGAAVADAFDAARASELATHWNSLPEQLEGQFVVARLTSTPPGIELITDPLGVLHVYVVETSYGWLASNASYLLDRLQPESSWDPVGVATYVAFGWPAGDRTLRREMRVVPGGQRWRWRAGTPPCRTTYFTPTTLSAPRWMPASRAAADAARRLTPSLRRLAASYGELSTMLTGGRDSRVVAALLAESGVRATYTTGTFRRGGKPLDVAMEIDATIAASIARTLAAPHRVSALEIGAFPEWRAAARDWAVQFSGLRSIGDLIESRRGVAAVTRLPLFLGGDGGGIAKGFYATPALLDGGLREAEIAALLTDRVSRKAGALLQMEAWALVRGVVRRFVADVLGAGTSTADVADAFYAMERVRRFLGSAQQTNRMVMDRFQILCSRAWIKAAFRVSPADRRERRLHAEIIRATTPQLLALPHDDEVCLECVGGEKTIDRRGVVLREHLTELRASCLDRVDSRIWDVVDRAAFEMLSDPAACEAAGWPYARSALLCDVLTLFEYDASITSGG